MCYVTGVTRIFSSPQIFSVQMFARIELRTIRQVSAEIIAEVNKSSKISISAQPLKMALHKNPGMHGTRIVIFLHESKIAPFWHD